LPLGSLPSTRDYLNNDSRDGAFRFSEAGLNAAINPIPRTRIIARAFTYDLGEDVGEYDVALDYAPAEYTFQGLQQTSNPSGTCPLQTEKNKKRVKVII